jgi:hypothetical protein
MEQLRQMEAAGKVPPELARLGPAQRIYTLHRQLQQQRYGPVIAWWNDRIRELQPSNPFVLNSTTSLRTAKDLFTQNPDKVDARLWKEKGSPQFLPTSVFEPLGIDIIQRMLDSGNGKASPVQREQSTPSTPSSNDMQAVQLLSGGHQSRAFKWLVGRLFAQDETEFAVGNFLAQHPKPGRQDIDNFTRGLPEDMADDIDECGWNTLVLAVDQAVLNAVRDPGMQVELMRALNIHSAVVAALVDRVRRTVFCRKTASIVKIGMNGHAA